MTNHTRYGSSRLIATALITAALSSFSGGLAAATFSTDLQIGGSVELSTTIGASPFSDGNVTQNGTISTTAGGATTTNNYSTAPGAADGSNDNATIVPAPLTATLTDTGDGIGYGTSLGAGLQTGVGLNKGYDFITAFNLDLKNTSLTDTFTVTLMAAFSNKVDAAEADAWADSKLDLERDNVDLLFSEVLSDTFLGDMKNRVATNTKGEPIDDSGVFSFDVILTPGGMAAVAGTQQWEGGVFTAGGASDVDLSFDLTIENVACSGTCTPSPVPLPAAAYLFASALSGLTLLQRRRKRATARSQL